uniref:Uncharacterized protein n=1 Tax=Salmonella sp. TaxID=599 RepID=A0A482EUI4_SALSP|nr:hypothetical protein NNIBIDOC_00165 [Salmonella sp.]
MMFRFCVLQQITSVPVGSILEWNEEMVNGVARRWWYVHRIFSYGIIVHVGSFTTAYLPEF